MSKTNKGHKNPVCPKCRGEHVNKAGHRASWNKGVKKLRQAFECQSCGHQFRERKSDH